jgi:hypothetical protein
MPKKRRPQKRSGRTLPPAAPTEKKPVPIRYIIWLLLLIAIVAMSYFYTNAIFPYAFLFYYGAAAVLGVGYVAYNRFFMRKGMTPEMLPDTMTPVEKRQYLDAPAVWREKSKWMLFLLIPLILVIGADIVILFLLPTLREVFSFGS